MNNGAKWGWGEVTMGQSGNGVKWFRGEAVWGEVEMGQSDRHPPAFAHPAAVVSTVNLGPFSIQMMYRWKLVNIFHLALAGIPSIIQPKPTTNL